MYRPLSKKHSRKKQSSLFNKEVTQGSDNVAQVLDPDMDVRLDPFKYSPLKVRQWPDPKILYQTEKFAMEKHSSLLQAFINYGHKKFYI